MREVNGAMRFTQVGALLAGGPCCGWLRMAAAGCGANHQFVQVEINSYCDAVTKLNSYFPENKGCIPMFINPDFPDDFPRIGMRFALHP